ncbi:hypothetical protein [Staphylococcus saprophyticus]|uniref:hypothetical protein n=1 Tax=Staphylococcus saprophyticus TaxID=29385 RepID=UPI000853E570|nr:hypothetical protein [Staphylococcus saprophyticus]OEK41284.1 hypothetical protein ASS88_01340 [Staphylococcus saprophyticus]
MEKFRKDLTNKELDVESQFLKTMNRVEKEEYLNSKVFRKRSKLNKFNGADIEYFAVETELDDEKEYLNTLSQVEKEKYMRLSSVEQHKIIKKYRVSENIIGEEVFKLSEIKEPSEPVPEPEVYDFDDIESRIIEIDSDNLAFETIDEMFERRRKSEIYLSPGESKFYHARMKILLHVEELEGILSEMQKNNPNFKVATHYSEVPVNYHNKRYFDAIKELTEGVDVDSLTPYEIEEIRAESIDYEHEILASQPTKATPKKATPTKAKKDTKLVEYVRSVEESLENGVIDSDYAKQAIINYLEANL